MIVFLMLICCGDTVGGEAKTTTPEKEDSAKGSETVHDDFELTEWTYVKPVELNLDDMTFSNAFEIQRRAKGEGHTFWWNGSEYTTDLHIEVSFPIDGQYKWVLNSDDMDDHCRSNIWDECGICSGTGPKAWFIDRDGDGLGDPNTSTLNCKYPSVDEE